MALFAAAITLAVLLQIEHEKAARLSGDLQDSEQKVRLMNSKSEGLQLANEDLQKQIQTLEEAPPLFTLPERIRGSDTGNPALTGLENEGTAPQDTRRVQTETPPLLREEENAKRVEQERKEQARRKAFGESNARYNQRLMEQYAIRRGFFAQVPQEVLSPEYLEANQQILAALDDIQKNMSELVNPELEYEERRRLNTDVFLIARDVSALMDKQRDILLNDYGQLRLGLSAEQTQHLVEYINTVNELSSITPSF